MKSINEVVRFTATLHVSWTRWKENKANSSSTSPLSKNNIPLVPSHERQLSRISETFVTSKTREADSRFEMSYVKYIDSVSMENIIEN